MTPCFVCCLHWAVSCVFAGFLVMDPCLPLLFTVTGSWGPFMLRHSTVANQCVEVQQDPSNSKNLWLENRPCDTRSALQQFTLAAKSPSPDQFGTLQVNGMCVQAPTLVEMRSSAPVRVSPCSTASSLWKYYNAGWFVAVTTGACLSSASDGTKLITATCGSSGRYLLMSKLPMQIPMQWSRVPDG